MLFIHDVDRRDADAVHEDNRNVKLELNFIQAVN